MKFDGKDVQHSRLRWWLVAAGAGGMALLPYQEMSIIKVSDRDDGNKDRGVPMI